MDNIHENKTPSSKVLEGELGFARGAFEMPDLEAFNAALDPETFEAASVPQV
ncbi:MAG TPA: hypothetical protein VGL53_29675 [Bryobacteraceae bacterium]|jgi:hypothetical protein